MLSSAKRALVVAAYPGGEMFERAGALARLTKHYRNRMLYAEEYQLAYLDAGRLSFSFRVRP